MAAGEVAISLPDEAATLALGRRLAALVASGDVIALWGGLGAGKTTLARGFVAGLAARAGLAPEEVPSPSFPLVEVYELGEFVLWHFDLYRIEDPAELEELGFAEALGGGITLIEWPERAGDFLPEARLDIHLEWDGAGRRARVRGRRLAGDLSRLEAP
jgi:tRNA threonylcarbamoyladenosine biosynthesis protein TsaE